MLGLEVMSLFLLGLLGAAIPAAGSGGDDDEDKDSSEDDGSEAEARAPAAEDAGAADEGTSLLDYAAADYGLENADAATDPAAAAAPAEEDPWAIEAEDAAYEDAQEDPEAQDLDAAGSADLDVLAAIARLTAASPAAEDEEEDTSETVLAAISPEPSDAPEPEQEDTAEEEALSPHLAAVSPGFAADDKDGADDEDAADDTAETKDEGDSEQAATTARDDLTATTIVDYQPGSDQIEITIFAPAPDTAVDVVLQQTADGTGTEVLIEGKLRAILDGVLPGDVDANDLYIEFAG